MLINDSAMRKDYVLDNFSKVEMTKKIMKVYQDLTRE